MRRRSDFDLFLLFHFVNVSMARCPSSPEHGIFRHTFNNKSKKNKLDILICIYILYKILILKFTYIPINTIILCLTHLTYKNNQQFDWIKRYFSLK